METMMIDSDWTATRRPGQLRRAVLVLADPDMRAFVAEELRVLRWTVREAASGAQLFALLEQEPFAAALLDPWLADLEIQECVRELRAGYPTLDVLGADGAVLGAPALRGPCRGELLHALRRAEARLEPAAGKSPDAGILQAEIPGVPGAGKLAVLAVSSPGDGEEQASGRRAAPVCGAPPLPELLGSDPRMLEVSRRIHLVSARRTPVLIHGQSGTGKELVARALHRLSGSAGNMGGRFVAINCAAIPEALVEAELFGHARGAFTGAVGARIGRIEAAAGGTIFLDEIGELPLAVQSKLLRFLESGEIQRVGENEAVRIDARVVAATHRKLGAMVADGAFRLDLLHRLAVFLIETPALAGRTADIDALIEHRLVALAAEDSSAAPGVGASGGSVKRLSAAARARLHAHAWPGNVRELEHTLERAWILAGGAVEIDEGCIDFGAALL